MTIGPDSTVGQGSENSGHARASSSGFSVALLCYFLLLTLLVTWSPLRFAPPTAVQLDWRFGTLDVVINLLLLTVPGFVLRASTAETWARRDAAALSVLACGLGFSLFMEAGQLFMPDRFPSAVDVIANGLSAWLGAQIYDRLSRRLQDRLPGRLSLETPLMALLYLATGLLWVTGLSLDAAPWRVLLAIPLGLMGAGILLAVWQNRHRDGAGWSANGAALVTGAWFVLGFAPAVLQFPIPTLGIAVGLVFVVRIGTITNAFRVSENRRFEAPTLWRISPLVCLYLVGLVWSPVHMVPEFQSWKLVLRFGGTSEGASIAASLRIVEYAVAFSLLGFMIAELRGRLAEPRRRTMFIACTICSGVAIVLELLRGMHPLYDASAGQAAVATAAGTLGGYLYLAQLAAVRTWLAHRPGTPARPGRSRAQDCS